MSTAACGSVPARVRLPRLLGDTMPPMRVKPHAGPVIHDSYIGTLKWIGCVSGTSSPGLLRQNRCDWVIPVPGAGGSISRLSVVKITGESRWSCRFLPTPGRSTTTSNPRAVSSSAGPMPLRSRMRGESMAPAESTTWSASARMTAPSCSYSTPVTVVPSSSSRCTHAPVTTVSNGEPSTGSAYAFHVESRTPSRIVSCWRATPSRWSPL